MNNEVVNGFDRMKPGELLIKASFIISEMTANVAVFATPEPSLATVKAAATALEATTLAAENRDRVAVANRNEKKDDLVRLLRKLGMYVNMVANGNRAIALASGFSVAKERTPSAPITFVEAPVLALGVNAGELEARLKKVENAKTYQYYITTDRTLPVEQWVSFISTKSKYSFSGLQSATRYYIRVAAVGVNDQKVFSDVSTFVTQ